MKQLLFDFIRSIMRFVAISFKSKFYVVLVQTDGWSKEVAKCGHDVGYLWVSKKRQKD